MNPAWRAWARRILRLNNSLAYRLAVLTVILYSPSVGAAPPFWRRR